MMWGKPTYGGRKYDLTHLDPQIIQVPAHAGGAPIPARVRYGSHVFTEAWSDNYVEAYRVKDGGKSRCFCEVRYGHSLHLPAIFATAVGGRVLFDPSMRLAMLGNPPGSLSVYGIFFTMKAVKKQPYLLDCLIVSAHENPRPKAKVGMEFPHLASLVASGKPIPWPKK